MTPPCEVIRALILGDAEELYAVEAELARLRREAVIHAMADGYRDPDEEAARRGGADLGRAADLPRRMAQQRNMAALERSMASRRAS